MKRLLALSLVCLALGGCAVVSSPVTGFMYTGVSGPITTGPDQTTPNKVGRATMRSIFGIYASGDASIQTAAKNGGISKIHHVDYEAQSIFGVIADFTTVVYGE
jgi:hypothetical protein